jgi:multidrug transporter EmrE-like cation transporter
MNKWIATGIAAIAASWMFASSASAQDLSIKCAYPFWPGFAPVYLAQSWLFQGRRADGRRDLR